MKSPKNFEMIIKSGDPDAQLITGIDSEYKMCLLWDNKKIMKTGIADHHTKSITFAELFELLGGEEKNKSAEK